MRKLTFEEFLDWCDEDTRAEWINGRVVVLSPDNVPHNDLVVFLGSVLSLYVRKKDLGKVHVEGILMKMQATNSARLYPVC